MAKSFAAFGLGLAGSLAASAAVAGALDAVRERGVLNCGVSSGVPGFSYRTEAGAWEGFDVEFCRAVAAAVLGDASKVAFTPTTAADRFDALASGAVDLLARNTTWTFAADAQRGFEFVGVSYYDGQGFLAPRALGARSARELAGAPVCVQEGTTSAQNLEDFFRTQGLEHRPLLVATNEEAQARYLAGDCAAFTADVSALAATRSGFERPGDHVILPEIVSKEPLGPLVRHGDNAWADVVRWTFNAMVIAEEHGVTAANVAELAAAPGPVAEVNRLLGTEGDYGALFGLSRDWAVRVIAQVGNYGEVFDRTIGEGSPIGLARGLNASYARGGLLYAPPFR